MFLRLAKNVKVRLKLLIQGSILYARVPVAITLIDVSPRRILLMGSVRRPFGECNQILSKPAGNATMIPSTAGPSRTTAAGSNGITNVSQMVHMIRGIPLMPNM